MTNKIEKPKKIKITHDMKFNGRDAFYRGRNEAIAEFELYVTKLESENKKLQELIEELSEKQKHADFAVAEAYRCGFEAGKMD